MMARSFRGAVVAAAMLQVLAAEVAWAQLAPTGPHHAGRASDTGHSSVSGTGGYSTAVSLDFPPARGGLPVPVAVVHGQRSVGAVGLGWDLPLSFVRHDTTIAQRRPAFSPGTAVTAREQVTLSLAGRTALMVKDGSVWRARQDAPDLLLFQRSNDTWQAYDGNGNEFTFVAPQGLGGSGLWVLSTGRSTVQQNRVDLQYEVAGQSGPGWNGVSLDLVAVRYNTSPSDPQCTKDEIILGYGTPSSTPLSVSFLEALPIVRMRTLSTISVRQRASCGAASEMVRSYHFTYQPERDPDTKLPRLASVQLGGRQSTPEATARIPHGDYGYDTATRGGGDGTPLRLEYVRGADINFPTDLTGTPPISNSHQDPTVTSPSIPFDPTVPTTYASWQNLIDVTGDGRPDFVYRKNNQLWVAMNRPSGASATSLTALAPLQLSAPPFTGKPLGSNSSSSTRYGYQWRNEENVWRQTVDINGDGRLDVIDATESPDMWFVYL